MRSTSHSVNVLFKFPLFTVLGAGILFVIGGCRPVEFNMFTQPNIRCFALKNVSLYVRIGGTTAQKNSEPQNARELMQALNAEYNRGHSKTEVNIHHKDTGIKTTNYGSTFTEREIDARYAREEWLQRHLDRGVTIKNFGDYAYYLSKRHTLALLQDNPNFHQSGIFDIPPTEDWETYKAAYIDKLVNDQIKLLKTTEQSTSSENGPFRSVNIIEDFHTGKSSN